MGVKNRKTFTAFSINAYKDWDQFNGVTQHENVTGREFALVKRCNVVRFSINPFNATSSHRISD